jgi:hypothetical protein
MEQLAGDGSDRPALPAGQAFDHAERLPFLSQRNQIDAPMAVKGFK